MVAKPGKKRPSAGRKPKPKPKLRATPAQKATLADLARRHSAVALAALVRVAETSESDAVAVAAAVALLDRGYGKPPLAAEPGGKKGGPLEVTDDARERIARRIAGVAARAPAPDDPE